MTCHSLFLLLFFLWLFIDFNFEYQGVDIEFDEDAFADIEDGIAVNSAFLNGLSRLWWYARYTYDEEQNLSEMIKRSGQKIEYKYNIYKSIVEKASCTHYHKHYIIPGHMIWTHVFLRDGIV